MPVFHDLFDCILTIWLSGCQTHKNSHLDRTARESNEAQLKHEGTGDLRYFASLDQHSHNTFQSYYTCLIDGLSHCTFYTGCFLFLWSTKELSLWHTLYMVLRTTIYLCRSTNIYADTHTYIYISLCMSIFFFCKYINKLPQLWLRHTLQEVTCLTRSAGLAECDLFPNIVPLFNEIFSSCQLR